MKAPLSWLREHTQIDVSTDDLVDIFTFLGLEVESVSNRYTPLKGVVIGKVLESRRHPNADRLTVNNVDVGPEVLQIVCGASNVKAGLTVPVILAGHKLPDGTEIKKSKIRGEISCGMICSERELGISEEAQGIMELDNGFKAGEIFSALHFKEDPVFDIAVLPNRPDCLSISGLARELSAKLRKPLNLLSPVLKEGDLLCDSKAKVTILDPSGCPRYAARHISGVKIGPSPEWMVKRLRSVGMRSINNVVDVTNFVLMELGHPLHAFDYNKIAGREIIVRRALPGEKMKTLDGMLRELSEKDLLICDAEKPVALAGVMGGESSEVSDSTTEILLESAYFNPKSISVTSKRMELLSEASFRFARGADPGILEKALDMATSLICELSGGVPSKGFIDVNPGNIRPLVFKVRTSSINRLLGTSLSKDEIKESLQSIGIICTEGDDFMVTVPTGRPDLYREADITEEVARLRGYDTIPVKTRASVDLSIRVSKLDIFRESVRGIMTGLGLMEVKTNSLVNPADEGLFAIGKEAPVIRNPLSVDMSILRTCMMPSLLSVVGSNKARSNRDITIFELGKVFEVKGENFQPIETEIAAIAMSGLKDPVQWNGKNREADIYIARGLVDAFVSRLTGYKVNFTFEAHYGCEGLKCEASNVVIGRVLNVSGIILKHYNISEPVYYIEIDLEQLFRMKIEEVRFKSMSKFPPSDRDLAVVTDEKTSTVEMINTIRAESQLLEEVVLFDVFRGKGLGENKKSTAFSLRFRKPDGTLMDKEVDAAFEKILSKLKNKFNAILR